jgi:hypothetical protein
MTIMPSANDAEPKKGAGWRMYRGVIVLGACCIALGVFFLGFYYGTVHRTQCTIYQFGCMKPYSYLPYAAYTIIGYGLVFLFYYLLVSHRLPVNAQRSGE